MAGVRFNYPASACRNTLGLDVFRVGSGGVAADNKGCASTLSAGRVRTVTPGRSEIVVCVPVTVEGLLDPRWGRADRVAVATVGEEGIVDWQEFDIGWGSLHDAGTEGSHHARVARFLREHGVEAVVAHHMGAPMAHMLGKMGLTVRLGETVSAKEAAARVLGGEQVASATRDR